MAKKHLPSLNFQQFKDFHDMNDSFLKRHSFSFGEVALNTLIIAIMGMLIGLFSMILGWILLAVAIKLLPGVGMTVSDESFTSVYTTIADSPHFADRHRFPIIAGLTSIPVIGTGLWFAYDEAKRKSVSWLSYGLRKAYLWRWRRSLKKLSSDGLIKGYTQLYALIQKSGRVLPTDSSPSSIYDILDQDTRDQAKNALKLIETALAAEYPSLEVGDIRAPWMVTGSKMTSLQKSLEKKQMQDRLKAAEETRRTEALKEINSLLDGTVQDEIIQETQQDYNCVTDARIELDEADPTLNKMLKEIA